MASSRRTATNENVSTYGNVTRDYTALATWEAATDIDLVSASQSEVLECYDDAASFDDYVNLLDATTNSSYFRIIRPASGQGHDGTPNNGVFFSSTTAVGVFTLSENNSRVHDLSGTLLINSASSFSCFSAGSIRTDCGFVGSIAANCLNSGAGAVVGFNIAGDGQFAINCLACGNDLDGFRVNASSGKTVLFYNNTSVDNGTYGFYSLSGDGSEIAKNCCASGNTTADWGGGWTKTTCTAEGANPTYVNATGDDYHLAVGDVVCRGNGTDLSADGNYAFDDDIDFESRSAWDIGFDEFSTEIISDLLTEISAGSEFLQDLTTDIQVNAESFFDLSTDIQAVSLQTILDLDTEIAAAFNISFKDLNTDVQAVAELLTDLNTDVQAVAELLTDLDTDIGAVSGDIFYDLTTNIQTNARLFYDLNTEISAIRSKHWLDTEIEALSYARWSFNTEWNPNRFLNTEIAAKKPYTFSFKTQTGSSYVASSSEIEILLSGYSWPLRTLFLDYLRAGTSNIYNFELWWARGQSGKNPLKNAKIKAEYTNTQYSGGYEVVTCDWLTCKIDGGSSQTINATPLDLGDLPCDSKLDIELTVECRDCSLTRGLVFFRLLITGDYQEAVYGAPIVYGDGTQYFEGAVDDYESNNFICRLYVV